MPVFLHREMVRQTVVRDKLMVAHLCKPWFGFGFGTSFSFVDRPHEPHQRRDYSIPDSSIHDSAQCQQDFQVPSMSAFGFVGAMVAENVSRIRDLFAGFLCSELGRLT